MKKIIFIALILAIFWHGVWQFGYINLSEMNELDQKLWTLMANLKWLTVIGLYIAWRVTPESNN